MDAAPFADFPLVAITGRMLREWRDVLSRKRAADLRQGVRRQPCFVSEVLPTYAPKDPLGLVFPLRGGERRDKKSYGWAALRKAAKIDRHVRWHDLRHTFASSLVAV